MMARMPIASIARKLNRSRRVKRVIDYSVAGLALGALAPVIGGITGVVIVAHGWPPLFTQSRPGLNGSVFRILKFRTMTNTRGADGNLLPDAERLTRVGRMLRATSLDELPELLNVLRGEMSLVGPRPLLVQYLDRYNATQKRRHDVRPGITGLAQVRGRNALTWDEKFRLDVEYVDDWSNTLDLKILFETLRVVFRREGISHTGDATMPEFMGNE